MIEWFLTLILDCNAKAEARAEAKLASEWRAFRMKKEQFELSSMRQSAFSERQHQSNTRQLISEVDRFKKECNRLTAENASLRKAYGHVVQVAKHHGIAIVEMPCLH